jgi:hypothetical protein
MNHTKYIKMDVDETRNRQKGKSVETMGQSEDDQLRQMDIWENNLSMILFTMDIWKLSSMTLLT